MHRPNEHNSSARRVLCASNNKKNHMNNNDDDNEMKKKNHHKIECDIILFTKMHDVNGIQRRKTNVNSGQRRWIKLKQRKNEEKRKKEETHSEKLVSHPHVALRKQLYDLLKLLLLLSMRRKPYTQKAMGLGRQTQ